MLSAPLRILISGTVAILAYIVAVAIVFQSPPTHELGTALLLFGFLCSIFALFMRALEPLQALPSIFAMFYFSFFYILPGAVQISSNTFTMADVTYNNGVSTEAALVILGFLLTFFIGQSLVRPGTYDKAVSAIEKSERDSRVVPIAVFVIVAIFLGVLCIHRFGLSILLTTRGDFKDEVLGNLALSGTEVGLLLMLPRAMTVVAFLLLIYAISRWRREKPSMNALIALPLLAVLVPIFSLLNYPPALARNWQFGVLLSFLLVFIKGWRPWLRVGLVVGMVLTMFSLFQWLNVLRHYNDSSGVTETIESPIDYLKHMDLDGYQTTMNTVVYTDIHGHAYGKQLLAAVLFPVPRSIWSDKGESSGQRVAKGLGYWFTNLSTPLPAEFFFDFSFGGVFIGGLLVGYLYRKMDYMFAAAVDYGRPNLHLIIVGIVIGFTIFIMRGALYPVANIFAPLAMMAFLLLKAPAIGRLFTPGRTGGVTQAPLQRS